MATKTKKIQHAGRFSHSGGTNVRKRFNVIESQQRQDQPSPFHPTGKAKRIAMGIWKCLKTGKVFAGNAYHLTQKQ
ncbi:MAG TPA: 50S ribosomal protein L37ae [Candidatus Nanoarchaeia archaeon]|nr:50S ribosomal protein L37ae [Candidatus Nanoarchaeia archaeon]